MRGAPPERPVFAPAVVDTTPVAPHALPALLPSVEPAVIEISVGIATVRIRGAVDAKTLAAVLKALKVLAVIVPPTGVRVLVATKPVDFRKGMDGLAAYVQEELQADPFSGVDLRVPSQAGRQGQAAVLGRHRRLPPHQAARRRPSSAGRRSRTA